MSLTTRRRALAATCAAVTTGTAFAARQKLRIGVTDWNLNLGADPQAVPLAAQLGFEGIQISFGRKVVNGKMPVDDSEVIARYLQLSKQYAIPIDGTCVDMLHDHGLKSDKLAPELVFQSIRLTKQLNAKVLLLPFFGAWALSTNAPELPEAAAGARISATDAFHFASKENIQTHGGMGFTWELDCHLYYRRAKQLGLTLGSARVWKDRLVNHLEKKNVA